MGILERISSFLFAIDEKEKAELIENYYFVDTAASTKIRSLGRNALFQIDLISIISESMAELAEYRDADTGDHLKRVSILTERVAMHLATKPEYHHRIDENFIELIKICSPLHDIGKVDTPDNILNKKDRLNDEEILIMRRHAGVGGKILEHLDRKINVYDIGYFRMASRIAYEHHERYDGSGYPNGLSGEDISLEAQITAIVDVFDALMSHRPYKPAFSADKSFSIIEDSKGTHFSPTLVEYFLEIKDTLAGLHAKYTDSI